MNVDLLLLIGDDVVKSAPSPSPLGLPRWCIAWVPWAGGGECGKGELALGDVERGCRW
ncbi:MAG: hypothetical protein GY832_39420 [Chloroflexi bacterium]|nr:hypothetical protein [Chloroflexota bacterium]